MKGHTSLRVPELLKGFQEDPDPKSAPKKVREADTAPTTVAFVPHWILLRKFER